MKHLTSITIFVMIMTLFFGQALGVTLDTSGTASEKVFKLINHKLVKAGGKPNFEIQLNATAIIHVANMPGWPEKTYLVTAFGDYNYDSGAVFETIYAGIIGSGQMYQSDRYFLYQGVCDENPWIHGNSSCYTVHSENDIEVLPGTQIPTAYPMSSNYMPNHLKESLVNWEQTYPPEDLSDWNPYAGSEVTNKLTIDAPGSFQVIEDDATSFQLDVKSNVAPAPQAIDIRWERLEDVGGWQGDIKLPEGSLMWKPIQATDSEPLINFPLTISTLVTFSENKPQLYRVRVRGVGETGWTAWRSFWVGQPTINSADFKEMVKLGSMNQKKIEKAIVKKFTEQEIVNRNLRINKREKEGIPLDQAVSKLEKKAKKITLDKSNVELKTNLKFELLSPSNNSIHTDRVNDKCRVALKVGSPYWMPFHIKVTEISRTKNIFVDAIWGTQPTNIAGSRWVKQESGQWVHTNRIILECGNEYAIKIKPEPTGGSGNNQKMIRKIPPVGNTSAKFKTTSLAMGDSLDKVSIQKSKETVQGLGKSDVAPTIQGTKRSFRIGETVVFEAKSTMGKTPALECFDGQRWSNKCAKGIRLQKIGAGAQTRYILRTKTPGKYRFRTGKLLSDEIRVGKLGGTIGKKVTDTGKKPTQVTPPAKKVPQEKKQTMIVHKNLKDSKKKMPVKFDKPEFKNLDGQTFPGGGAVLFNLKRNQAFTKYKVKYEVYQNSCKGKPFKVSTKNNFGKLPAGKYCVRAAYMGGQKLNWSKGLPFIVEEKKNKIMTPKKKISPHKIKVIN